MALFSVAFVWVVNRLLDVVDRWHERRGTYD